MSRKEKIKNLTGLIFFVNSKKFRIGIFIFLGLSLLIPKAFGDCEYRKIKETIYMGPNDWVSKCIYGDLDERYVTQWNYNTFDEPFIVSHYSYNDNRYISENKTSDSGVGDGNYFGFRNIDVIGGYIDIQIWIKEEIDYTILLYIFIPIFIVSIIIIGLYYQRYQRKKQLKKMGLK
ncbi:hypothetical protein LCGC14_0977650 [marine sediment metagenome]|uniref:Uncharacterized protein n=1 Tax=marine sediment metagenome TaxID=412755 RepID=A0A0F9NW32_9ZZZZ